MGPTALQLRKSRKMTNRDCKNRTKSLTRKVIFDNIDRRHSREVRNEFQNASANYKCEKHSQGHNCLDCIRFYGKLGSERERELRRLSFTLQELAFTLQEFADEVDRHASRDEM